MSTLLETARSTLRKAHCDMHQAMQNLTLDEVHQAVEAGGYLDRYFSASYDSCSVSSITGEVLYKYTIQYRGEDGYETGRIWIKRDGSRIVADY